MSNTEIATKAERDKIATGDLAKKSAKDCGTTERVCARSIFFTCAGSSPERKRRV